MSIKIPGMKTVRIILLAASTSLIGLTGLGATAYAQVPQNGAMQQAQRISVSQLTAKLEQAGYSIRDIDHKRYGWEVDVIDKNQQRLELKVDMQGNIMSQKYDD